MVLTLMVVRFALTQQPSAPTGVHAVAVAAAAVVAMAAAAAAAADAGNSAPLGFGRPKPLKKWLLAGKTWTVHNANVRVFLRLDPKSGSNKNKLRLVALLCGLGACKSEPSTPQTQCCHCRWIFETSTGERLQIQGFVSSDGLIVLNGVQGTINQALAEDIVDQDSFEGTGIFRFGDEIGSFFANLQEEN
jgi:hypothetical protein